MIGPELKKTMLAACLLVALAGVAAGADGYRSISSVTLNNYFDGSWYLETNEVFLSQVVPGVTVQARAIRDDMPGWYQHTYFVGPVVNLTPTVYLDAGYALAIDSAGALTHRAELNFNWETATAYTGLGVRGNWYADTGYGFLLPSISARFYPIAPLSLFGKFFLSVDTDAVVTESFWGEAEYRFSPLLSARIGATVSRATGFGYSLIAGAGLQLSETMALRYSFQYLSDTVVYLTEPQQKNGISNALIFDARF